MAEALTETVGAMVPVIIFLGCVGVLISLLKGGPGMFGPPAPIATTSMTRREQAMLVALEQVLPAYRIHAQVSMGALLTAPRRTDRRPHPSDRNTFSQKIVDFVVQDRSTGEIVALIEIDDFSHNIMRDRARDVMTARAGYTTIRIPASTKPSIPGVLAAVGHLKEPMSVDSRRVA